MLKDENASVENVNSFGKRQAKKTIKLSGGLEDFARIFKIMWRKLPKKHGNSFFRLIKIKFIRMDWKLKSVQKDH